MAKQNTSVLCRPEDVSVTMDPTGWQKRMTLPVFHSEDKFATWSLSLSLCRFLSLTLSLSKLIIPLPGVNIFKFPHIILNSGDFFRNNRNMIWRVERVT